MYKKRNLIGKVLPQHGNIRRGLPCTRRKRKRGKAWFVAERYSSTLIWMFSKGKIGENFEAFAFKTGNKARGIFNCFQLFSGTRAHRKRQYRTYAGCASKTAATCQRLGCDVSSRLGSLWGWAA